MPLVLTLLLAAAAPDSPSPPPKAEVAAVRPDFSNVTSPSAAEPLVQQGKLVRVYLFPVEFGGPEDPMNSALITREAAEARTLILGTLRRSIEQGLLDKMTVSPDYRGASIVPTKIRFQASNSKTGAKFEPTIEVW